MADIFDFPRDARNVARADGKGADMGGEAPQTMLMRPQGCESHATPVGMPVLSEFERVQDHDPAGCVCFIAFQRDADAEVRHGIGPALPKLGTSGDSWSFAPTP